MEILDFLSSKTFHLNIFEVAKSKTPESLLKNEVLMQLACI